MFRQLVQRQCLWTTAATTTTATAALKTLTIMGGSSLFSTAAAARSSNSSSIRMEPVMLLRLNNLQDNPGAVKRKRRVGRGIGSSKGKTCGRGHKGQKARSGGSIHPTFEGGQTPFYKLFPKRGFKNTRHEAIMNGVNLGTIQMYIDMKRLNPDVPITVTALKLAGLFKANAVKNGVKLLAAGKETLKQPVTIQLNRASESAVAAVEAAGGSVKTVHYNKLALRTALRPEKFGSVDSNNKNNKQQPKHARPPPKWQPYYTSWHKRGYLNPAVQMLGWFEKTEDESLEGKFEELLSISKKKFAIPEEVKE